MNRELRLILTVSIAIFGVGFLLIPSTSAQAQGLEVVFENEPAPLFDEANFLPGESVLRYADVTNNTEETKKIGLEIINNSSCSENCLSDVLDLEVKEGVTPLYSGSLITFYGAGEKVLSDLNAGATTRYYFSMAFNPIAGNVYQNSTADFDIKIGFFGEESIGPEVPPGGGGGVFIAGLEVYNETVAYVGTNDVTIVWDTNKKATSRVIYSPDGFPHLLQLNNPPNYGYVFSTVEDSEKVVEHSVTIIGLFPGVTYYYRCVSHTSPDETISRQHSFTTKGVAGEEFYEEEFFEEPVGEGITEEEEAEELVIGAEAEAEEVEEKGEEEVREEGKEEVKGLNKFLAAVGSFFNLENLCWILFFFIVVLIIFFLLSKGKKEETEEEKKKWWILVLVIVLLIILYFFLCPNWWILILIALILFILFLLLRRRKKKEEESKTQSLFGKGF